jgi:hypothetical protein
MQLQIADLRLQIVLAAAEAGRLNRKGAKAAKIGHILVLIVRGTAT